MDWNDDPVDVGATASAKCPNCASNIFFNEKIGRLVCNFCGGIYLPETLEPTGNIGNRDVEDAGEEESNKQEFVCDSCGATLVTDYNTAATFCAFCGSPTLIKRRLSRQFRPDLIIPFKVSKEEAINNYREWLKTHKGVPKAFRDDSVLEKITGFYVPFWLIDADCSTIITGNGQIDDKEGTVANFFIDRTINFQVKRVPFDGCKKISDLLMEAIEPFNYDELVPYNDLYLPGHYAQRYDKSALDMVDLIGIRLNTYAVNLGKQFTASEYENTSISSKGSYADNFSQLYAMMPVWFLNVKYKDQKYSIAVNGQTGEAAGSLPVTKGNVFLKTFLDSSILIPIYIIFMTLISALASSFTLVNGSEYFLTAFSIMMAILGAGGLCIFIPLVIVRYLERIKDDSITLDKAPDVEEYLNYKGKIDMTKRDSFSHMSVKLEENEEYGALRPKYTVGGRRTILHYIVEKLMERS